MLNREQKKYLRGLAHDRQVIVRIGPRGLTDNVLGEIEQALERHELVKVGIRVGDRHARAQLVDEICRNTGAEAVQRIGNTVTLYLPRPQDPAIHLPE